MNAKKGQVVKDYLKGEVVSFFSVIKSLAIGFLVAIAIGVLVGIASSSLGLGVFFFLTTVLVVLVRVLLRLYKLHKVGKVKKRKLASDLMGDKVGNEVMDIIETATEGKNDWSKLDSNSVGENLIEGIVKSDIIKETAIQKLTSESKSGNCVSNVQ